MTVYYSAPVNVEFEARVKGMLVERAATMEQAQPGYWDNIRAHAAEYARARLGNDYRYIATGADFK